MSANETIKYTFKIGDKTKRDLLTNHPDDEYLARFIADCFNMTESRVRELNPGRFK